MNEFNIKIDQQVTKLNEVQLTINQILETKQDSIFISKLQAKYKEIENFINQLLILQQALNYQKWLCDDITKISLSLNHLIKQVGSCDNDEKSPNIENNLQLKVPSSSLRYVHTPAENNVSQKCSYINKPTSLNIQLLEIEPVTQEEYSLLPKYMVGRKTLETVNNFVDVMNKTLHIKYDLLSKHKSTLRGADLQLFRNYKAQETNETKGKYFVLESDIAKQQGKKNLEKNTYSLLVILRHTKRLTEHRTGGLVRYIIC